MLWGKTIYSVEGKSIGFMSVIINLISINIYILNKIHAVLNQQFKEST